MALEIERKFLIDKDLFNLLDNPKPSTIIQGYLMDWKKHVLRIRSISTGKVYLTYKGPNKGISRVEKELRIPRFFGNILLKLCSTTIIKRRTLIPEGNLTWEVDEFLNLKRQLCIAEIELPSEDFEFSKPDWIREDVSHDPQYYNSNLVKEVI